VQVVVEEEEEAELIQVRQDMAKVEEEGVTVGG